MNIENFEVETDRYHIRTIGALPFGIDGADQYLLVRDRQQEINRAEVEALIMRHFYRECTRPGGYFCTSMRLIRDPVHDDRCIVIVHHEYDV